MSNGILTRGDLYSTCYCNAAAVSFSCTFVYSTAKAQLASSPNLFPPVTLATRCCVIWAGHRGLDLELTEAESLIPSRHMLVPGDWDWDTLIRDLDHAQELCHVMSVQPCAVNCGGFLSGQAQVLFSCPSDGKDS